MRTRRESMARRRAFVPLLTRPVLGPSFAAIREMHRQALARCEELAAPARRVWVHPSLWDDLAPLLQSPRLYGLAPSRGGKGAASVVIADKRVPPGYVFALPPEGVPVWALPDDTYPGVLSDLVEQAKADDRETFKRSYFGDGSNE